MGASQSAQLPSEDEEQEEQEDEDEEEEEEDDDNDDDVNEHTNLLNHRGQLELELGLQGNVKKVLEQEPEMLPCHASASPLSPQLSTYGTPRLGPSIKVWDPYNVLAPPPNLLHPPHFSPTFDDFHPIPLTHLYLISHGECHMNLRPDLIGGRCPDAALTPNGKRQARALAVFFKSNGIRFTAAYTSPLDRSRATALSVCQEINFSEDQIQSSEALVEMSQGHWEGCHRSEMFTTETINLMDTFQPDFCAPSGESLRQVEFRMIQFLNETVMGLPEKFRSDFSPPAQSERQGYSHRSSSHALTNSNHDLDGPSSVPPPHVDFSHRHRQGLSRKKSGKSRLQIVTTTGDQEADDEMSPRVPMNHGSLPDMNIRPPPPASCIGVFTHSVPIKCVITGLLGCSTAMSNKICIDDSSVTVLQHSWKSGWQIKKMNDTAHLRLL